MRVLLSRLLILGIVALLAPATQACWFPWAPTYGVGYGPRAAPYGSYGAYYGGYQPVSYASYSTPYTAGYYGYSSASYANSCCATSCCDPCNGCGSSACGGGCGVGSCAGGACGTGCGVTSSGTLRPTTDPISDRRDIDSDSDRQRDDRGLNQTFGSGGVSDNPPRERPEGNASEYDGRFTPRPNEPAGTDERGFIRRNRSDSGGTDGDAATDDFDTLPDDFKADDFSINREANKPPTTNPVHDVDNRDEAEASAGSDTNSGDSGAADDSTTEDTPEPPESDLGTEVPPDEALEGTEGSDDQTALRPLLLAQTKLRSSQFDVVSSRRLAAESRQPTMNTRFSESSTRRKTLQWISLPAPAGRVRL